MNIVVYVRPNCTWSESVCEILDKYGLPYDRRDIVADVANYDEMVRKSGQRHAPCVEIEGVMIADASDEDVENYLLSHELIRAEPYKEASVAVETESEGKPSAYFKMTPPTKFF